MSWYVRAENEERTITHHGWIDDTAMKVLRGEMIANGDVQTGRSRGALWRACEKLAEHADCPLEEYAGTEQEGKVLSICGCEGSCSNTYAECWMLWTSWTARHGA